MSYICSEPGADIQGTLVDDGNGNYSGECVSLVKRMCAGMPATSTWKKGIAVKGSGTLARGTAITTFNAQGRYHGHAAIYIRQDKTAIEVWDQYNTPPVASEAERLVRELRVQLGLDLGQHPAELRQVAFEPHRLQSLRVIRLRRHDAPPRLEGCPCNGREEVAQINDKSL